MRAILVALLAAMSATSSFAYRPFDGTDAAVTEAGAFELETGFGQVRTGSGRSVSVPAIVGNWGIAGDTEIVLEGRVDHQVGDVDGYRNRLGDTALSVKHVWRRGTLQDAEGLSFATECGLLLPEWHGDDHAGATCAGIASHKWEPGALHLNFGMTYARDHAVVRQLGLVAEGPEKWTVRPVAEMLAERDNAGASTESALVGVIYQRSETLAFDAGVRHAHGSDGKLNEVRLGLTWTYGEH